MTDIQPDTSLNARIVELEQRLQRAEQDMAIWHKQAATTAQYHEQDIAKIGEMLNAEADRRGWCDEYVEFVDNLNQYLHMPLPVPARDWLVTITYTVTADIVVRCEQDRIEEEAYELYSKFQEPSFKFSVPNAAIELTDSDYQWRQS